MESPRDAGARELGPTPEIRRRNLSPMRRRSCAASPRRCRRRMAQRWIGSRADRPGGPAACPARARGSRSSIKPGATSAVQALSGCWPTQRVVSPAPPTGGCRTLWTERRRRARQELARLSVVSGAPHRAFALQPRRAARRSSGLCRARCLHGRAPSGARAVARVAGCPRTSSASVPLPGPPRRRDRRPGGPQASGAARRFSSARDAPAALQEHTPAAATRPSPISTPRHRGRGRRGYRRALPPARDSRRLHRLNPLQSSRGGARDHGLPSHIGAAARHRPIRNPAPSLRSRRSRTAPRSVSAAWRTTTAPARTARRASARAPCCAPRRAGSAVADARRLRPSRPPLTP